MPDRALASSATCSWRSELAAGTLVKAFRFELAGISLLRRSQAGSSTREDHPGLLDVAAVGPLILARSPKSYGAFFSDRLRSATALPFDGRLRSATRGKAAVNCSQWNRSGCPEWNVAGNQSPFQNRRSVVESACHAKDDIACCVMALGVPVALAHATEGEKKEVGFARQHRRFCSNDGPITVKSGPHPEHGPIVVAGSGTGKPFGHRSILHPGLGEVA